MLTLDQLYNKASIIKVYMDKKRFEPQNMFKTRGLNNVDLKLIGRNTSLMGNFYINIKLIDSDIKCKTMIKNLFMHSFHHFV